MDIPVKSKLVMMNCLKKMVVGNWLCLTAMIVIFCLSSCKSTKTIQAAISKKDTISAVIKNTSIDDSIAIIKTVLAEIHKKRND